MRSTVAAEERWRVRGTTRRSGSGSELVPERVACRRSFLFARQLLQPRLELAQLLLHLRQLGEDRARLQPRAVLDSRIAGDDGTRIDGGGNAGLRGDDGAIADGEMAGHT